MQRNTEPVRKLQLEISELKKQFLMANEANQSQKIEIRKLQNELKKKDKKIQQASMINKAIVDKRAGSFQSLNERNNKLQHEMQEKIKLIESLQCGLSVKSIETRDNETSDDLIDVRTLKIPKHTADLIADELLHEVKCVNSNTRVYEDLSHEHLLSIIQGLNKHRVMLQDDKSTMCEFVDYSSEDDKQERGPEIKVSANALIKSVLENQLMLNTAKMGNSLVTTWLYLKNVVLFVLIFIYVHQLMRLHFW